MSARRLLAWMRDLLRRRRVESELDEEIRFHLEREIERLVRSGVPAAEARRRALADFGSPESIKQECREVRETHALETTLQDVRYGARVLARHPAFTITAVLTVALTVGAVTAALGLAYTFYLRPLPVPDPGKIVEVLVTRQEGSVTGFASYPDYVHFRDRTRTLASLSAVYPTAPLFVSVDDRAREVNGAVVSADFFRTLRLEPALGRFFRPEEDRIPGRDRVVVLGHDFWRSWFGGSADVLGEELSVNGTTFTVIGVAPASFSGTGADPINLYLPTMMLPVGYRWCADAMAPDCTVLRMFGRLAAGAGVERAAAELESLIPARWANAERDENSGISVVAARGSYASGVDRDFLELLGLVAGVLLLVCCANLAGLLLARGNARLRELAVRASLGASRRRLVRQLLTESVVLAALGGGAGLLLSAGLLRLLQSTFYVADSSGHPLHYDFGLVPSVAGAAVLVALGAGALFGIVPALATTRCAASAESLRTHGGAIGGTRHGGWLLGGQATVAVALIVIAGLLGASAARLVSGMNLEPEHVALMRLRPRLIGYRPERAQAYLRGAIDRLRRQPNVRSASLVGTGIAIVGFAADVAAAGPGARALRTGYVEVGADYFRTLGTPVLRGREFDGADDVRSAPVAVVNVTAADLLWPDGSALGQGLRIDDIERTVIGVVADVPLHSRAEPPRPYVYVPFWQNPDQVDARLQILVDGDPAAALPSLIREVHDVDPDVPVSETIPLEQRLAGMFRPLRLSAAAVTYAGVLAVFLSALGLYASLAAAVGRRTREIGVRQALGATARDVLAMIRREGMRVILGGALCGLVVAALATRLLRHMLHGAASQDLAVYVAGAAVVALVGLVASWIPARRAVRIQPVEALRVD